MTEHRAYSPFVVKELDEDRRIIEGIATTPSSDRANDIVRPDGAKFHLPLAFLWQHDDLAPVGFVERATSSSRGIKFRAQLVAPQPEDPPAMRFRLDEAWQSVKRGLVRAVSIGFRPLKTARLENGGREFLEWDWIELSLVTIPANMEATITNIKRYAAAPIRPERTAFAVNKAGHAANAERKSKMKTIAEQIAELEAELAEHEQKMGALGAKQVDGSMSDDEAEEFDSASNRADEIEAELKRLERIDRLQKGARQVSGGSRESASRNRGGEEKRFPKIQFPKREDEEGKTFARAAIAFAKAYAFKGDVVSIATEMFKDRDPLAVLYVKAAVAGGNTGVAGYAGNLATAQDVPNDFVTFLRKRNLLGQFGQNGVPGLRVQMLNSSLNRMTGGTTAFEVDEGAPTPISTMGTSPSELPVREFAGGIVVTKRLLQYSNVATLETQIRDDLTRAVAEIEDKKFSDSTIAGSITNGVAGIAASGTDAAAVRVDLQKLLDPIESANMDPSEVVLMTTARLARAMTLMRTDIGAAREFPDVTMRGGILEGNTIIVSNNIPQGQIIALHAPSVVYGDDGQIMIDVSDAVAVQQDGAPTNNAATGVGTVMTSMIQTRSVYIQATHQANWKVVRPNAVARITGAAYNGALTTTV